MDTLVICVMAQCPENVPSMFDSELVTSKSSMTNELSAVSAEFAGRCPDPQLTIRLPARSWARLRPLCHQLGGRGAGAAWW